MHNKLLTNAWKPFFRNGPRKGTRFYYKSTYPEKPNKFDRSMPKDNSRMLAMRRQREKVMMKTEHYPSSRVTLQVLGSGARGAPRSLYVSTDHTKYLFNCGEGTQRLSHEHHLRLNKLENIFVTTPAWNNMGGMPGMALTVQESGVPRLKIHGPKGTADLFKGVQRFVTLKGIAISEATCNEDEPHVDTRLTVRYVPLFKPGRESPSTSDDDAISVDDSVDYCAYDFNENGKRSSSPELTPRKLPRTENLIKNERVSGSMAYICKLPPKPGALSLEKCVDKGITPGPLFGRLKAGEDVTLDDGTVILSSDVCDPADPGPVFIVVECPEEEYLDSLLSAEAFAKHQTSGSPEDAANCVIHFTPEHVLQNSRYRQWMKRFPRTTRHVIINEENRCFGSEAIHRFQHKLHLLHPTIFPFISEEGIAVDRATANSAPASVDRDPKTDEKPTTPNETIEDEIPLINRVKTLDAIHLRPLNGFDTSGELMLTPRAYIDEIFAVDGFLDCLAELQTGLNARMKSLGETPEYPKIVMLGTGSCIPNKTRNTSGILLRIDEDNSVILDCGEGTADQLVRFYGREKVDDVLATIKAIYVSHLHTDHHIGLIGLLQARARVTKERVNLLAPEQIGSWLRIYNKRFENIDEKYELFPNKDFDMTNRIIGIAQETRLQQAVNGAVFKTVPVRHCANSFGVSITLKDGYKIVYSGDTMPCDRLVNLGKDCDLLIHEATMEDDLEGEAKMKLHSTISQAINVGERMRAKFTLLTHFSQRYSKLPVFPENGKISSLDRVGIAYDNMQISVSQLSLLPLMYPALNLMFSEFRGLLEDKAIKRERRLKRETEQKELDERTKEILP